MGGIDRLRNHLAEGNAATGSPEADELLREDPNALIIAVLLDQQVKAEMAFEGPYKIKERLGHLDMKQVADMNRDALQDVFGQQPAVHRFYNKMAGNVQDVARVIADEYGGDAAKLWDGADSWDEVEIRVGALPGVGASKIGTLRTALDLFGYDAPT